MLTELRLYTVGELTHMRSMCVGVAETGVEHCSPAKNHKVTFLIVFFSLVRKERKGQKEESIDSRLGDADTHASHMCQSLF